MTIFWPDRSVDTTPVSGLVTGRPLRPVMMNASLGPATLMRVMTARTASRTRAAAAARAIRAVVMAVPLGEGPGQGSREVGSAGATRTLVALRTSRT